MTQQDTVNNLVLLAEATKLTRDTFERHLDAGRIEVRMAKGNWWAIRRNGQTKLWKNDANRVRVPWKAGLRVYGAITETDFLVDKEDGWGRLNPMYYRIKGA